MKAWMCAAALVAMGLTGRPALASHGCGPWGGTEMRCIGNNGLGRDAPVGLSPRDYTAMFQTKAANKGNYRMIVDVWRSVCGFPGAFLSRSYFSSELTSPDPAKETEHAGYLQCVEFFAHDCESPIGTRRFCDDVIDATIKEGR
jgi:hypothetical protein